MITEHQVEQGSPEWHALRLAHPFTGAGSDKLLRFGTIPYSENKESSFGGNFYTKRGHLLEEEALELYEAITGNSIKRVGFVTNTKWPNCGYSPDGLDLVLDIPLEVKAFEEAKHLKMFKGEVPMKVLAQNHFGQFIWEKRGSRLIIYNPDLEAELAIKIIDIRFSRPINSNFKRILKKEVVHVR
jgi:hypothetical protein